jgi:hypothetical protein
MFGGIDISSDTGDVMFEYTLKLAPIAPVAMMSGIYANV